MICVKFKYVNLEYTDALLGIAPSAEGIMYSPQQYLKAFLSPLFNERQHRDEQPAYQRDCP